MHQELKDIYAASEIASIHRILLEDLLGWSSAERLTRSDEMLEPYELDKLNQALRELKQNKPIQHIVGKTSFYGHEFKVNRHTLIPRRETEELVDWICESHDLTAGYKILDFCTGSGCIGISLTYCFNNSVVKLLDNSEDALQIAAENAINILQDSEEDDQKNSSATQEFGESQYNRVIFEHEDLLAKQKLYDQYDIIVTNPPYVREMEKTEMHANVLDYEPDQALFVSDGDPLIFYRKVLEVARNQRKAYLYFEINQYLAEETKALAEDMGYKVELRKDMQGNWRMLRARLR